MKKLLLPLLAILFLFSCGKESLTELQSEIEQNISENVSATARSSNKRNICHNGKIKNVSINAIPDHRAHGDAVDMDEDGFFDIDNPCSLTDCDDSNGSVNPSVIEVCDGIDNNCDGQIDEGLLNTYYADADGDGFGDINNSVQACTTPTGYVSDNTDCDDTDAAINPDADEICGDGIDNNCNDEIDEGCISIPTIVLNGRTWTAENLNIDVPGSVCYDNDPDNCITYGRMYNFEEAQTACPALGAGWRVPTRSEWDAMILSFGGIGAAPGSAYDELIDGGSSGFNLLFGGYEQDGVFSTLGTRGRYWSSTGSSSSLFAWQYQLIESLGILGRSDNLKISRRSCRCILDQ